MPPTKRRKKSSSSSLHLKAEQCDLVAEAWTHYKSYVGASDDDHDDDEIDEDEELEEEEIKVEEIEDYGKLLSDAVDEFGIKYDDDIEQQEEA